MSELPDLKSLSEEAKDALIVRLWQELQSLRQQVESVKKRPKKTAQNSSLPPAKGFKAELTATPEMIEPRSGSLGRAGGGRSLHPNPDHRVVSQLKQCPNCGGSLSSAVQQLVRRYDKIELPPIQPVVTRVEQYGCRCEHCEQFSESPVPVGLEAGSPFSQRIGALVTYLRYGHAISYQRLVQVLSEVFGLEISEGGIANLLKRIKEQVSQTVDGIAVQLRSARLVGSDETSARVNGKTQWEWVFQNEHVCLHVIRPSRGSDVMQEVMQAHQPEVWVSDLFSAQRTHPAQDWQVCLAHQLRDVQYGIDAGDDVFCPVIQQILWDALALHKRWQTLAASTYYQYRRRLHRRLVKALKLAPTQADGVRLHKRYASIRAHLFLFLEDMSIPPTNNASEQALRMSVIFRKVTNGFRCEWGRDLFAAVRSIINTGKRQDFSALDSILAALDPDRSLFVPS